MPSQTPTTLEIQHRFAEILSAGPLCLEDIADKLHPFGRDHEDAVVAVFSEIVDVTGIVLTKLDGSAKGGIVVQVQRELGVPVKLVGLGEGADDLAPFDPGAFVDALLG